MNRMLCLFLLLMLMVAPISVSPVAAQTLTTLHVFGDGSVADEGLDPDDVIRGSDGNFYGATYYGGLNQAGTVYKTTPSGAAMTFTDLPTGFSYEDDSDAPVGLTQGTDGNFYGESESGGANGTGAFFKVTPTGAVTTLHTFPDPTVPNDGAQPEAALTLGTDGNFYGVTELGGVFGYGNIFKITPTGVETILHIFQRHLATDAAYPEGPLVQGSDGNFYGTTAVGGASVTSDPNHDGFGTVYKITPTGAFAIVYSLTSALHDGYESYGALLEASDGNFYGTTAGGGVNSEGVVFRVTPTGGYTVLHNFGDASVPNDGYDPHDALIQGSDGSLYGTTAGGGTVGTGTIFKITLTGTYSVLYSFTGTVDGGAPVTGLIPGAAGFFYGTTTAGGSADGSLDGGTFYRFNLFGVPITIASLAPDTETVGGPAFTLTINGTGFTGSTTVTFGSTPVAVFAQTPTQMKVMVPAGAIAAAGPVTVVANDPVGGVAAAIFTVLPAWQARDVAAVPDGTARLLWDRSDGAAGIWTMSAANTQTAVGPTYGPYQGWSAQDVTAAGDGTSRILWNRYDGATGVWVLNQAGVETAIGPTYGPYTGWRAIDLAAASDGTSRLLWRYINGQAGLLSLNAQGRQVISGRAYGPFPGWSATAVGASGDGTARILWTRSDGAMGLWTMNAADAQQSVGLTYGPYSDSHGHWTATDLSTSADGTSCVLWKRSDGAVGVWTFSAANTAMTSGPAYGPYPGWTAAAMDAASDTARVLWVNANREAGLWSFGGNDAETLIGPIYGPY